MPAFKRRRPSSFAVSLQAARPYTAPSSKRARKSPIIPGRTRVSGYYGRYSGSGGRSSGELKFHDIDIDDAIIAQNGTIQNTGTINIIPQGVTEIQRIGRKCTIKSLNWRYQITLFNQDAVAAPLVGDTIRVILYLDKQCNGATAAVTGILESDNFQSFRNLANSSRFQVLMDKEHSINYAAAASDNAAVISQPGAVRHYSFYKTCTIPLEFDSTTGALTEIRSNNLGVLILSDQGAVCGFESKMRLRFSDN